MRRAGLVRMQACGAPTLSSAASRVPLPSTSKSRNAFSSTGLISSRASFCRSFDFLRSRLSAAGASRASAAHCASRCASAPLVTRSSIARITRTASSCWRARARTAHGLSLCGPMSWMLCSSSSAGAAATASVAGLAGGRAGMGVRVGVAGGGGSSLRGVSACNAAFSFSFRRWPFLTLAAALSAFTCAVSESCAARAGPARRTAACSLRRVSGSSRPIAARRSAAPVAAIAGSRVEAPAPILLRAERFVRASAPSCGALRPPAVAAAAVQAAKPETGDLGRLSFTACSNASAMAVTS